MFGLDITSIPFLSLCITGEHITHLKQNELALVFGAVRPICTSVGILNEETLA
jgi:hypothetical protein